MTTALIDGDVILYAVGFAAEGREYNVPGPPSGDFKYAKEAKQFCADHGLDPSTIEFNITPEPIENVFHSANQMIGSIVSDVKASDYVVVISGANNFRYEVDPEYKANRKDAPKPVYYDELKEFLIKNHNGKIINGMEADDYLGIEQSDSRQDPYSLHNSGTVVCTIDKDLKQIVGWNYNWKKEELTYISPEDAQFYYYTQLLTGDTIDNIPGIPGIGDAKATKLLCQNKDAECVVGLQYAIHFDDPEDRLERNKKLLRILTYDSRSV